MDILAAQPQKANGLQALAGARVNRKIDWQFSGNNGKGPHNLPQFLSHHPHYWADAGSGPQMVLTASGT